ncbi:MAG: chemotaxis protein CheW [Blastocatellia bacterium]
MDDGKETMILPPGFELELDELMPSIDADSFLLPDDLPMPPESPPPPILPNKPLAPPLPDNLPVPDEIEAGIEALFKGAPSFERPEFDLILAEEPDEEPDYAEAEPDYVEETGAFGAAQPLIPVFNRFETALVPTRRGETPPTDLALVPTWRRDKAEPTLSSADFAVAQEKYVVFSLTGTKYAVPMSHILEVCELEHFTPVPNVPEWVMGITNLRGDITSVVNIRALLNTEPDEWSEARSLLVTQTLEGDITVCLAVERVIGLATVPISEIQTVDSVIRDRLTPYVRGVHAGAGGLLSVLNLESLLRSLEIVN